MRYYEILYILNPNFEQSRVSDILKEVEEFISKSSSVINHRVWGKKRLAYPIDQHKYGIYILLQFESDQAGSLVGFEDFLKLNNSVLRHQNVRLDEKPEKDESHIIDDSEDIDEDAPVEEKLDDVSENIQEKSENESEVESAEEPEPEEETSE